MYICDIITEATEEGSSRNILLKVNGKCVVCCHHDYHIYIHMMYIYDIYMMYIQALTTHVLSSFLIFAIFILSKYCFSGAYMYSILSFNTFYICRATHNFS